MFSGDFATEVVVGGDFAPKLVNVADVDSDGVEDLLVAAQSVTVVGGLPNKVRPGCGAGRWR